MSKKTKKEVESNKKEIKENEEIEEIEKEKPTKKQIKEMQEDFLDEKPKKEKKKGILSRIFDFILWVVLFAWIGICLYDFYNVSNDKEAKFCIKKETITYDDGTISSCTGLGYKAYYYNRKSYKGKEFGPFWIKPNSN